MATSLAAKPLPQNIRATLLGNLENHSFSITDVMHAPTDTLSLPKGTKT